MESPIAWARWGRFSRWIAMAVPPKKPPVLVLSLPRSGSSWVGLMLGSACDALYLREPVTQSDPQFHYAGTVFALDHEGRTSSYRRLANKAFIACPDFTEKVIPLPEQWEIRSRRRSRLVIKEVNPQACAWYLQRYQPRLIFLVRHPAAVALSVQKQGWLPDTAEEWACNGEFQGRVLREAKQAFETYPHHMSVLYEDLCDRPLETFSELFRFAGLTWDDNVEATITRYSQESHQLAQAWREQVPSSNLEAIRRGYRRFDLPWYQDDSSW